MKTDKTIYNIIRGHKIGNIPGMYKLFIFLYSLFCGKEVDVNGCKFIITKYSKSRTIMYHLQGHEPHITTILKSLLKEGMIVADVGAALGYFTFITAKEVGRKGEVYAIEPDECVFNDLKKNIEINNYENIFPVQTAISDSIDSINMLDFKEWINKKEKLSTVKTITLDSLKIDFDLIKMDIEGYEVDALKGMKNILHEGKVKIICEIHPKEISVLGYNVKDIQNLLAQYNYSIHLINKKGELELKNNISNDYAHYLFTKR